MESIKRRRQKIHLAAESLWPSADEATAEIRAKFGLPPRRA
jgi:hypothetical protein